MVGDALAQAIVKVCEVNNLRQIYPDTKVLKSPLLQDDDETSASDKSGQEKEVHNQGFKLPDKSFVDPRTFVIQEKYFRDIVEL